MFCTRTLMMRKSTVDLDRIKKILSGKSGGRNSGKTLTSCYLLAKEIEWPEETLIHFVVGYYRDVFWMMPMIERVLEDCTGLFIEKFDKRRMLFKCNGVTVIFIPYDQLESRRRGVRDVKLMYAN